MIVAKNQPNRPSKGQLITAGTFMVGIIAAFTLLERQSQARANEAANIACPITKTAWSPKTLRAQPATLNSESVSAPAKPQWKSIIQAFDALNSDRVTVSDFSLPGRAAQTTLRSLILRCPKTFSESCVIDAKGRATLERAFRALDAETAARLSSPVNLLYTALCFDKIKRYRSTDDAIINESLAKYTVTVTRQSDLQEKITFNIGNFGNEAPEWKIVFTDFDVDNILARLSQLPQR